MKIKSVKSTIGKKCIIKLPESHILHNISGIIVDSTNGNKRQTFLVKFEFNAFRDMFEVREEGLRLKTYSQVITYLVSEKQVERIY
jgi:hypothetical protein